MEFLVDTKDLDILAKDLRAYNLKAKRNVNKVMTNYVRKTRDRVRYHASRRPGPNYVTGRYANSIRAARGRGADMYRIIVWSDHPASHRLEYGFVGADSLGRMYSQPPYPHFRPAIAELAPALQKDLGDAIQKAWFVSGF